MFYSFRKQSNVIGINVTDESILCARMIKQKNRIALNDAVHYYFSDFEKEYDKKFFEKAEKIIISIQDLKSISKTMMFNNRLSERDIEKKIVSDQEKYFPGFKNKLVIDFSIVQNNKKEKIVKLHAIKEKYYQRIQKIFQAIGIKPVCVELNSQSLVRFVSYYDSGPNKTKLFVGENQLVIFRGGEILFLNSSNYDPNYFLQSFLIHWPDITIDEIVTFKVEACQQQENSISKLLKVPVRSIDIENLWCYERSVFIAFGAALRGLDERN